MNLSSGPAAIAEARKNKKKRMKEADQLEATAPPTQPPPSLQSRRLLRSQRKLSWTPLSLPTTRHRKRARPRPPYLCHRSLTTTTPLHFPPPPSEQPRRSPPASPRPTSNSPARQQSHPNKPKPIPARLRLEKYPTFPPATPQPSQRMMS